MPLSPSLSLAEFQQQQERAMDLIARDCYRLLKLDPAYDVMRGIRLAMDGNPLMQGVSAREIAMRLFDTAGGK